MNDAVSQQSRLKSLIAKGKEQGYLTYAEVNDHLPDDISDPDQVEDIIQMINDMAAALGDRRHRGRPHHGPGTHVHARDGHR
jgi:phosphosulfolactate synthase (CoM biosynthesis protein A)